MLKIVTKILVFSFFFTVMGGYSIATEKGVVTYEKDVKKVISEKVSIFFSVIEVKQHVGQILFDAVANKHPIPHLTLKVSV